MTLASADGQKSGSVVADPFPYIPIHLPHTRAIQDEAWPYSTGEQAGHAEIEKKTTLHAPDELAERIPSVSGKRTV